MLLAVIHGAILVLIIMTLLYGLAMLFRKPDLVDLGWTLSVGALGWIYALHAPEFTLRKMLFILCISLWAARLVVLLLQRFLSGKEDRRYIKLSQKFSDRYYWKYFAFFEGQALVALVLSTPFLFATFQETFITVWDVIAVMLFAIGILGEHTADETMREFRKKSENQGKVCREGMWRYSRHPNFFFEWLQWIAFALFAISAPLGWLGLISPLLMLFTLLYVTGIPPTEEVLLISKGDAYKEYQRLTNAFIPWFPKDDH